MKKYFVVLPFLLSLSSSILATGQISDLIIYNDSSYALLTNPLEEYFQIHPQKRPNIEVYSTALWRGYTATFEIKNNLLCLKDIEKEVWQDTINYETTWKSVLTEIFPDKSELVLNWFSGLLVIPRGEIVNYVHMGYASEYESYTILQINNGVLEREKDFSNNEYVDFKKRQFIEFKKTKEYKELFDDLSKENKDPDFVEQFISDYVIDYTTKFFVDLE